MRDSQRNLMKQAHRFKKLNFWKLDSELNGGEHMMVGAIDRLSTCNERAGIRVSEIAAATDIPMPGVSRGLNSLEKKGIIERRLDPGDRRNTLVFFTEKGQACADFQRKWTEDYMDAVFERFGEAETEALAEQIGKLIDIFAEELEKRLPECPNKKKESEGR